MRANILCPLALLSIMAAIISASPHALLSQDVANPAQSIKLTNDSHGAFSLTGHTSQLSRRIYTDPNTHKLWDLVKTLDWATPNCHPAGNTWTAADRNPIQGGSNHLMGHSQPIFIDAGPKYCRQISCEDNSAIEWCNDNRYGIQLDNAWPLATGAQKLIDACGGFGQIFTAGG